MVLKMLFGYRRVTNGWGGGWVVRVEGFGAVTPAFKSKIHAQDACTNIRKIIYKEDYEL